MHIYIYIYNKVNIKQFFVGILLQHGRLRIWYCHCRGSGCCCGAGSVPGPGTSICHGCSLSPSKEKAIFINKYFIFAAHPDFRKAFKMPFLIFCG